MTTQPKKDRVSNPESVFLNACKGKKITVVYASGDRESGTLAWVDRYSFGLDLDGGMTERDGVAVPRRVQKMISKGAYRSISLSIG